MTISIKGLEIAACHGVHEFEKTAQKKFVVDCEITTDFYLAAKRDDLNSTVSYSEVCALLVSVVKNNVFNLIEKLVYECAFAVMEKFKTVNKVTVCVHKPEAPVPHKFEDISVSVTLERCTAYLSIGSSMGDRRGYLERGIELLKKTRGVSVEKVSNFIETEPYGGVAENKFLNGAIKIKTYLSPQSLLFEIHRIEEECGRERTVHWGDRTLDIDIILFGDKNIKEEGLIIPHPEYKKRDFVLIPLRQIAPELNI